ncbi:hypothetical protein [Shewanella benthica]|uniref:Uncharacterized protein n=1 Tax=Shewanella benthica KT99 TaxID=314608 RepID=A9DIA9_9GAMM|nr:hypothetical protein [Shewanella benthica]EDP99074.1 hypothetical protein KT99_10588 [Shewanella benthica KT99]
MEEALSRTLPKVEEREEKQQQGQSLKKLAIIMRGLPHLLTGYTGIVFAFEPEVTRIVYFDQGLDQLS